MEFLNLILFILLTALFSFLFWRESVIFLIYWTLLAGTIRKWLLPNFSDAIFVVGHIILTGIYLRVFVFKVVKQETVSLKRPLKILLGLYFLWGILSTFNPSLPDFRIGIMGIVIHFYYIPLMFIVPYVFRSKEELISFLKRFVLFSLPLLILGIIQFLSPVDSIINRYVLETQFVATVGGHARITSTFSYISGYTSYLNFLIIILIYLLSIKKLSKSTSLLLVILSTLAVINLFMTGSRGPLGISIIMIALYSIISARLGINFIFRFSKRTVTIISVVLLVFATSNIGKEAYEAFTERASGSAGELHTRILDTFTNPFKFIKYAGLWGYGIGSTYQGAERLKVDWGDMFRDFEPEPERVMLELGLVGYLLVFLLRLLFLIYFWKLFKVLKDLDLKLLAIASLLFQLQFFHFNNLLFNLTSGVFYYFLAGFLLLLPKLDKEVLKKVIE